MKMGLQRQSKPSKTVAQTNASRSSPATSSSSSSVSSHLAMVELKQRILNSLSKLSDRDTHQIAVEDLEKIIQSLSNDGVSMFLNCLYDAVNDQKPAVKKEGLRLLAALCVAHTDAAATHLTKIIGHIVKRLKDSDSLVRDACRDAVGSLAGLYLKGGDGVVSLFVKPLFEVMGENNKSAQSGASMCLAKMVESATDQPAASFQKLCPRVCKYLNNPNFFAKASLLQAVASLSQVGAIAPQNLEQLLQCVHEFLGSSDWATRKAAADALIALSLKPSNISPEVAASTLNALEACRFDKIKPVRESMMEALQLWKNIAGKEETSDENKDASHDGVASGSAEQSDKKDLSSIAAKNSSSEMSPSESSSKGDGGNASGRTVGILRKKLPALTDKELNPEFFQKLESRGSDDFPVEVAVPRRHANASNSQNEEDPESNNADPNEKSMLNGEFYKSKYESMERGSDGDRIDSYTRDLSRSPGLYDGLLNSKGNWLAIQKQLLQLERQQTHLMNMLQDFMGGSHDNMMTLESRVWGLERVVEDMARDLSISTGRRGGNMMAGFEGSSNRSLGKCSGFSDYSGGKIGRANDGRLNFGDRFGAFDGVASSMRNRGPSWRSDENDGWDLPPYSKNSHMGSRRGIGAMDIRPPKSDNNADQVGSRRGWEKGAAPVRFGEGPSARSVWQASKDEATLEAIRVAGEDKVVTRNTRVAIPEMTAEALGDDGTVQDRDPTWNLWRNAMDALHVGDMDSAFVEVLSSGDEVLLVKLMDRTGPVFDQLSTEVAGEVVHVVSQLIMEQNLFEVCLCWVQQLVDIVMENGSDVISIPIDVKREILLNLHDASSTIELAEDWDGSAPDQLLLQLASAWEIDLQQLGK